MVKNNCTLNNDMLEIISNGFLVDNDYGKTLTKKMENGIKFVDRLIEKSNKEKS